MLNKNVLGCLNDKLCLLFGQPFILGKKTYYITMNIKETE